jgi:hypothetical protein
MTTEEGIGLGAITSTVGGNIWAGGEAERAREVERR